MAVKLILKLKFGGNTNNYRVFLSGWKTQGSVKQGNVKQGYQQQGNRGINFGAITINADIARTSPGKFLDSGIEHRDFGCVV